MILRGGEAAIAPQSLVDEIQTVWSGSSTAATSENAQLTTGPRLLVAAEVGLVRLAVWFWGK